MKRVVVVGASTGLGRCMGTHLGSMGHPVALLARSEEKLVSAAEEAGEGAVAITADVTDEASISAAIAEAAERLGGIDAVIYAAAIGPLVKLEEADAATWRSVLDTNVVGASITTAAALPHLQASTGTAIFLSTVGASYTPTWPGLGVYQTSKAALERMVDAWRTEHPTVGFTRLTLGECGGGEGDAQSHFNTGWDMELAVEIAPSWLERKLFSGALMNIDHVLAMVHALVEAGSSLTVPEMVLAARPVEDQQAPAMDGSDL